MHPIETHGLSRRFRRLDAVRSLDLRVPQGAVYAFMGHNGAGKTTTIQILMNLLAPTCGDAVVLGKNSRNLSAGDFQKIGYVSENQRIPGAFRVTEYLAYWRGYYQAWDAGLEQRLLAMFELPPEAKVRHLSRGMTMKLALLSSLAFRPELLVLDEPFSGLDPIARDDLVHALRESMREDGLTVLLSSHDLGEIGELADHVGIIRDGELQLQCPLNEALTGCRKFLVEWPPGQPPPETPPREWKDLNLRDGRLQFFHTAYRADTTEASVRESLGGGVVQSQPITLKELFRMHSREPRYRKHRGDESR